MGTSLFDSTTPAISNMMGLLGSSQAPGPQQPMQPITAQQMPQTRPNLPPPQGPKLVDRLHDRMTGLLDSVKASAPPGYEGLLSSDDITKAKPGRGTSILGRILGLGSSVFVDQQYGRNLDHMLKMKEYALGLADARDKKALEAREAETRRQLSAKFRQAYPNFATMSPDELHQAMTAMFGETIAAGLYKDAAGFASVLPSMQGSGALAAAPGPDGQPVWAPKVAGAPVYERPRATGSGRAPSYVPVPGPDGQPVWGEKRPGAPVYQKPGAGASGTPSGVAQGQQARLLAAVSEARAAIPRMDAYEDKMLANPDKATPGLLTQIGGKMATRHAGAKDNLGIISETVGENATDPDYLQYMRDAGLMARATQLMSSRGGSEAMVSAEQLLNRAVTNKNGLKGSVDAARKSRNAIFGRFGGLMQSLTPEQAEKVEAGLRALEQGENSSPAVETARAVLRDAESSTSKGNGSATGKKKLDAYRHLLK